MNSEGNEVFFRVFFLVGMGSNLTFVASYLTFELGFFPSRICHLFSRSEVVLDNS